MDDKIFNFLRYDQALVDGEKHEAVYGPYGPLDTLMWLYNPYKGGLEMGKWLEAGRPWLDGKGDVQFG